MEAMLMQYMILAVVGVAVIVGLSTVSDRLGIASPLILMLVGVGISLLPFVGPISIKPQWILVVLLPPLLYSAAIAVPNIELRRDFTAVGGLAVFLVLVSAVVLGLVFHALLPDVSMPFCVALGAILSPTDAAATTIIKKLGVSSRVRTILQGEALFNDATSLVLLRTAIAATAASVSYWGAIGEFLKAAGIAIVIGAVIGWIGVRVRRWIRPIAPASAISLLLPFVAYIPAELVHASGLVAAVAAGIVGSQLAPKHLDARQRSAERANWATVEFLLEGAVFLLMGLELYGLVVSLWLNHETLREAFGLAALALVIVVGVRAVYIAALVFGTRRRTDRMRRGRDRLKHRHDQWRQLRADPTTPIEDSRMERHRREIEQRQAEFQHRIQEGDEPGVRRVQSRFRRLRLKISRYVSDVDYLLHEPLGAKEGVILTWAGMRGVVTLAAAQTLPLGMPHRDLFVLIAFFVAAGSLIVQGGTLTWVIKWLRLAKPGTESVGEWIDLRDKLDQALEHWQPPEDPPMAASAVPLARLRARREALLELGSTGAYSAETLGAALAELDADEIGMQSRLSREE
ncbi:MAG: sodium:proton antiporter [Propionibacteriaceae bacterium]|jgi:CPA1 family monovalent cation:H+ antiporter|nr:sodium:proton antiporter [Propionibacteriaceae bacterium]